MWVLNTQWDESGRKAKPPHGLSAAGPARSARGALHSPVVKAVRCGTVTVRQATHLSHQGSCSPQPLAFTLGRGRVAAFIVETALAGDRTNMDLIGQTLR